LDGVGDVVAQLKEAFTKALDLTKREVLGGDENEEPGKANAPTWETEASLDHPTIKPISRQASSQSPRKSMPVEQVKLKGMAKWLYSNELFKKPKNCHKEMPKVAALNCRAHEGTGMALLKDCGLEKRGLLHQDHVTQLLKHLVKANGKIIKRSEESNLVNSSMKKFESEAKERGVEGITPAQFQSLLEGKEWSKWLPERKFGLLFTPLSAMQTAKDKAFLSKLHKVFEKIRSTSWKAFEIIQVPHVSASEPESEIDGSLWPGIVDHNALAQLWSEETTKSYGVAADGSEVKLVMVSSKGGNVIAGSTAMTIIGGRSTKEAVSAFPWEPVEGELSPSQMAGFLAVGFVALAGAYFALMGGPAMSGSFKLLKRR